MQWYIQYWHGSEITRNRQCMWFKWYRSRTDRNRQNAIKEARVMSSLRKNIRVFLLHGCLYYLNALIYINITSHILWFFLFCTTVVSRNIEIPSKSQLSTKFDICTLILAWIIFNDLLLLTVLQEFVLVWLPISQWFTNTDLKSTKMPKCASSLDKPTVLSNHRW